VHSLLKFDSKEKFIWFCYLVTYFANGYLFYLCFFVVKITLFDYVHCAGYNLTRSWFGMRKKKLDLY